MSWYVVLDEHGNYQVIGATGFIPQGVICEAPAGAQPDDGPYIVIQNGTASFSADRANKPVGTGR